jgi:hypothetical protein
VGLVDEEGTLRLGGQLDQRILLEGLLHGRADRTHVGAVFAEAQARGERPDAHASRASRAVERTQGDLIASEPTCQGIREVVGGGLERGLIEQVTGCAQ